MTADPAIESILRTLHIAEGEWAWGRGMALISEALAAAREAGARAERKTCIDQLEYARDLPEAERIIPNGPDRTFVKGIITAAVEMIRARGEP